MELHFEAVGQGEPLIILHGLFGSSDNWKTVSTQLSQHFTVFALDQRNHGRSPHSSEMDYTLMAGDVRDFMNSQGLPNAFILGHSMGGKTAMQLALSHWDMVTRLIVADMSPRRDSSRHEKIIAGMRSLDLPRFQTRRQIEEALAPAVPELATRQFLLKNLARGPSGSFYWRIGLEEIHTNYARLTEPIGGGVPFAGATLFLRGETSDYLLEDDLASILPLFPRAVLQTIPAAGHLIHIENPVAFQRSVVAFLSDTS